MSLKATLLRAAGGAALNLERIFRPTSPGNPGEVKSILVLEFLLPLGYCVHLTPLYEALKVCRPNLTLAVATRGLAASLLRHSPYVDHLIDTPNALTGTLSAARYLRAELARLDLHPDLIFTGASDQRTRIGLLAFLASSAQRAGYTIRPELYHHPLEYDPSLSLIDNNLRLASFAGCSSVHHEPAVFFSPANLAKARALAAQANPDNKPLVLLVTQPSGGQSTGWHPERFAQVAREATRNLGCAVAYVGIPAHRDPIEQIRTAAGGDGVNLAGHTSVTELAALMAVSDYLVSLDTGTMHLGRAVGLPLVVLGPSWQKPLEWLPLGVPSARILRGPDVDTVPENYKLDEITASQVITSLADILAAYPASQESRASRLAKSLSCIDHLA